jgi:hypothetical protein
MKTQHHNRITPYYESWPKTTPAQRRHRDGYAWRMEEPEPPSVPRILRSLFWWVVSLLVAAAVMVATVAIFGWAR